MYLHVQLLNIHRYYLNVIDPTDMCVKCSPVICFLHKLQSLRCNFIYLTLWLFNLCVFCYYKVNRLAIFREDQTKEVLKQVPYSVIKIRIFMDVYISIFLETFL